jgi:cytochrome oxidase Cu insertion factor (SCO1/SenC/PrrC family)
MIALSARADATPSLFDQPWLWRDDHGQVVRFSLWKGPPLVVTLFYPGCRQRCPRTLDMLSEMDARYLRQGKRATFVLVSLDRSVEVAELAAFKRAHHLPEDRWHLLVGDEQRTRALCRLLGVHPAYDDGHIDHEVRVDVFDDSGHVTRKIEGWNMGESTEL